MKRFILAFIIGSMTYLLLGWLVFERVLGAYTEANTFHSNGFRKSEEEFSLVFLILSCSAYAFLLALILGFWTRTYSFIQGFKISAIVGTLIAVMADCFWYSSTHFYNSIAPMLADILAASITVGLTGGVISLMHGFKAENSKSQERNTRF